MNATGLCLCGCGQQTKLHPKTWRKRGWIAGQPRDYCQGHWSKLPTSRRLASVRIQPVREKRHAQIRARRKRGPYKAGGTLKAKAFANKLFQKVKP